MCTCVFVCLYFKIVVNEETTILGFELEMFIIIAGSSGAVLICCIVCVVCLARRSKDDEFSAPKAQTNRVQMTKPITVGHLGTRMPNNKPTNHYNETYQETDDMAAFSIGNVKK